MIKPPKQISIDLGRCPSWTLQKGENDSTTFIRCLDEDTVEQILEAARFCRQYASKPSYRLLYSSHRVWQQTIARASRPEARGELFIISQDILSALVGWLLIWRLIIDQAGHDLSQRFGKDSEELASLRQAKKAAYDAHQGYRLAEAIRNLVQHREMPPLNLKHTGELDTHSGLPVTRLSLTIPASWLLASPKCPATIKEEFKGNAGAILQAADMVDDAMIGIQRVLERFIVINTPQLASHINYLRRVFSATHPGVPLLMRAHGEPGQPLQIQMQRLDDLLLLVREAPVGDPYSPPT